jgi:tetratricopeptide (TPR) repeat protein
MLHRTRAAVLQAEGSFAAALRESREAARLPAARTGLFDDRAVRAGDHPALARLYEAMGASDSAVAVYERYLAVRSLERLATDAFELGDAQERLGLLYERRGEWSRAVAQTRRFVELWRDADAGPQRRISAARRRAANLIAPVASPPVRAR